MDWSPALLGIPQGRDLTTAFRLHLFPLMSTASFSALHLLVTANIPLALALIPGSGEKWGSFPDRVKQVVTPTLQHINHTGHVVRDTLYPVLLNIYY